MHFLAISLLKSGVWLAMICAVAGLAFAVLLITRILAASPGNERMREISSAVQEGAKAYLNRQVATISVIAVVIFILLFIWKDAPTALGFLLGAVCSLAAGYIGMRIAVLANARVTQAATNSCAAALRVAFNGGAVTGLLVVGLALLSVGVFYYLARHFVPGKEIASLVGVALGASLISVFARLGGGIYTKAADVGADLVGKIESGLEEDDPRNPATIADNVGDNVGDCAGMAADVFETYAVSLIGAILIGTLTLGTAAPDLARAAVVYPFVLGGISVLGAVIGILFVNMTGQKPTATLMGAVVTSGIISAILFWPATHALFPRGFVINGLGHSATDLYYASLIGLLMTAVVVVITNYYTSMHYGPVRKIARASETGHATNIIQGLAQGLQSTAAPALLIAIAILGANQLAGIYGIGIAVMAQLSLTG
ncbi:MAG: sodium/proton-translocating pyrophosphatase, partial [Chthoniobacterales bacterium]